MVRQTGLTGTVEPCTPAERRGGTLAAPYVARGEGITFGFKRDYILGSDEIDFDFDFRYYIPYSNGGLGAGCRPEVCTFQGSTIYL